MIVVYGVIICVALIIMYMYTVAHEDNVLTHPTQAVGQNDRIRLFFISDVHNRVIRRRKLAAIEKVDAVIIGGDFCDKRTSEHKLRENLATLSALGPIYFVWGNNDREFGEAALLNILNEYGAVIVENDAVLLANRPNKTWISAIDDTSTKNYSFKRALHKCANEDVTICVSHNPQVFHLARQQKRISLLMGGHLHGGQIRLGKFGLHEKGSFNVHHGVPTLISNGYGTTLVPLRLGAKPQMHIIEMDIKNAQS